MKADGRGISLGLGNFSFAITNADTIAISFGKKIDEDSASWCFRLFYPNADHRMALAFRVGVANQERLKIKQFETIPLQD